MIVYEIGTGYTPIPAQIGAATEIVVEELSRVLRKKGIEVRILDVQAENRGETELPVEEIPVPWRFRREDLTLGIRHKLKRVIYSVLLAARLRRLLKEAKESPILHFHNQYNLFFFLLLVPKHLRRKCRVAYTVHSGIWRLPWADIRSTIRRRYFQEAFCIRKADMVVVLNEETAQRVTRYLNVPSERVQQTANGVNTDIYCPRPLEKRAPMILQVGSVCENKGQLRAVKLLLELLKKHPDLTFAYAGGIIEEDYQDKIRQFTADHGIGRQVKYLGMIPPGGKLAQLYRQAIATILPSRYEAFGLVAVESLASGTPVLIPEDSSIRFGAGCVLYNEESFTEKVECLLEDPGVLAEEARKNARDNFSWDKIAMDYEMVFAERSAENV